MSVLDLIPAPYRLAAELAIVVALAGGVAWFVHHERELGRDEGRAEVMATVNKQKAEASALLAAETARVRATEAALAAFKDKQEITDANNRELTQAQERRLVAIAGPAGRLRDPYAGRGGGGGGAAGQAATGASGGATGPAEAHGVLSKELSGFLLEQARSADEVNDAYASCRADALNLRSVAP
jgi:hypothetical protein